MKDIISSNITKQKILLQLENYLPINFDKLPQLFASLNIFDELQYTGDEMCNHTYTEEKKCIRIAKIQFISIDLISIYKCGIHSKKISTNNYKNNNKLIVNSLEFLRCEKKYNKNNYIFNLTFNDIELLLKCIKYIKYNQSNEFDTLCYFQIEIKCDKNENYNVCLHIYDKYYKNITHINLLSSSQKKELGENYQIIACSLYKKLFNKIKYMNAVNDAKILYE